MIGYNMEQCGWCTARIYVRARFPLYAQRYIQLASCMSFTFRGKEIREVALCGGSGAFLIGQAIDYGADVL